MRGEAWRWPRTFTSATQVIPGGYGTEGEALVHRPAPLVLLVPTLGIEPRTY